MAHTSPLQRSRELPISSHLGEINKLLENTTKLLLEAPPGSGKTTLLPLHLLASSWLGDKKILILQPRRIAAKAVAARMSELIGESVGGTVGYRIRLESKISKHTRIEVITEGLLTRRMLHDPELRDVAMIIFDEFHERSIHADIGLALALESANALRPDLRIMVMSATLGETAGGEIFKGFSRYSFEGTPYPVALTYAPLPPRTELWDSIARAIKNALARSEGDILAFLPGAYEIERTRSILEQAKTDAAILPLFGDLPYDEQRAAIEPRSDGRRKIVLATPIAETSLTIEGVRVVIDSGLHKVARSDASGLTRLKVERISRDAADQRAGRAGRTAPGECIRLWSEHDHLTLRASREPEILRTDLSPALLDLAVWGVRSFEEFEWITRPANSAITQGTELLRAIGAISEANAITSLGRILSEIGTHPRLALMAYTARISRTEEIAAAIIPILEERDPLPDRSSRSGIGDRIDLLQAQNAPRSLRRLVDLRNRWLKCIHAIKPLPDTSHVSISADSAPGYLLATAFPDRIAKRREDGRDSSPARYLLASGKGSALREGDPLGNSEWIVVAEMHEVSSDGRIYLAAPLDEKLFNGPLKHLVREERKVTFDTGTGKLLASIQSRVGSIVLRERPLQDLAPEEIASSLLTWLGSEEGFSRIPFSASINTLRERCAWLRAEGETALPDLSDEALRNTISEWLGGFLPSSPHLRSLTEPLIEDAIRSRLSWPQMNNLSILAPESITLPGGRTRRLRYTPAGPILDATIQELFGWNSTPLLGPSRTPITLEILSPARRPMQVTRDLKSFWTYGYPEVRKELRGRYPKHPWPEDVLHAKPIASKR